MFARDENHVPTDSLAKGTFAEKCLSEGVEMDNLPIVHVSVFIDREKALVGIESEMPRIVVREVKGSIAVADDEKLKEAKKRSGITVSRIVLILNDLFHGPTWADA